MGEVVVRALGVVVGVAAGRVVVRYSTGQDVAPAIETVKVVERVVLAVVTRDTGGYSRASSKWLVRVT